MYFIKKKHLFTASHIPLHILYIYTIYVFLEYFVILQRIVKIIPTHGMETGKFK